jgi:hypothetical protein
VLREKLQYADTQGHPYKVDVTPAWKAMTPAQRRELMARGWTAGQGRNGEVLIGVTQEAKANRRRIEAAATQRMESPSVPNATDTGAPPVTPKPFKPSTVWQEIPEGTVLPNGGEYRFDQKSGKNYARWKPENLPVAAADTIPPAQASVSREAVSDIEPSPSESNLQGREAQTEVGQTEPPETPKTFSQPESNPTTRESASSDPFVSRIANRFTRERSAQGEIGEVAPGQGYSTHDLVKRGIEMPPEEINQHISDIMHDSGGDHVAQAAAVRAEEARLSDRSTELSRAADANPTNLRTQQEAKAAFQDLTDFHNGPVAKVKQRFHAAGMALQGEIPVDLSTSNGLREAWLKENGKSPPAVMEQTFRRTAENVRRSTGAERAGLERLGQDIEKATSNRRMPSADEVINQMREEMGLGPCRI